MQTYLDLSKGLHTDFEPLNQPQKSYRYLLNGIRELSGSILNERGTELLKRFSEEGRRILGSYCLNNDVIICSASTTVSEIGVLDEVGTYTIVRNNVDLNFKLGSIIKMEGKKNYKGERIIYLVEKNGDNPARCINIDDAKLLSSLTFADDIAIQINPDTPTITIDSVVDGGSLPTGVYQATARLLTKSTNATPFGIISPIVPIIDDSTALTYDQQDGANPQSTSPKAINFLINNIDTSYAFLEVAIITYTGTANINSAHIVARVPIDGRSSILFTYSSVSQNKEAVDLEAIAIKPIIYDKAETIAQKDGILTLGNLTASSEDYNFQEVANLVKLKYFIEEIPYIPGYKDPVLAATKKSYQRDEVYSIAIAPEFTGQYNTTSYHIPGNRLSSSADSNTKDLGGYKSKEDYPLNSGYPTGSIYHHRMPTMNQEPIIVVRGGQTYLRVLGIECDFSQAIGIIPATTLKKLKGFSIVRQIRKDGDKSILTQGIANTHYTSTDGGHPTYKYLAPTPKLLYGEKHLFNSSKPVANEIGFYSPETTIYNNQLVGNLAIKTVAQLDGTQTIVNSLARHDKDNKDAANFQLFLDYTGMSPVETPYVIAQSNTAQYIETDRAETVGVESTNVLITGTNDTVNKYKNNGYLYLKLNGNLPVNQHSYDGKPEFYYEYRGSSSTDALFLRGQEYHQDLVSNKSDADRYLYNIVRELDRQYGSIFDASYIYCGGYRLDSDSLTTKVFGGDVFINKFGVVSAGGAGIGDDEIDYKVLSYYFCESVINTAYRHYATPVGTENTSGYIPGTTPYYPKLSVLWNEPADASQTPGILNLSWILGHGIGYNKQYSFENNIIVYYPKQLAEDKVTKFGNRVIYSEQSVEGEQIDSYRIFLPNNYHDIPKDKGEISDLFVHNNKYYIHTTGSLYLSAFNEKAAVSSSVGEVYLGNGGIFSRPSQPILTISGSYAGTSSSSGVNTPYGRFFTDEENGKVYMLTEGLKEISEQGMVKYFTNNLDRQIDSPSNGRGYVAAYDAANHRYLLTKVGQWTISYSPQLDSWSSFHSYTPYCYISYSQKLFSAQDNELYRHNVGSYGVYYGNLPVVLQLDIVLNEDASKTKTFDNLVFHTTSERDGLEQHYDTFSTLQCYNTTRNTGKCRLIVPRNYQEDFQTLGLFEVFAKLKSNEFRVALPNDLVIDVNQSIFTATNLANSRAYRPSLSGKWLIISLAYNNLRDNKFVLHTIGKIFKQRIR